MRRVALLSAAVLAGCAAAQVERTGTDEYAIGSSGRDNWRTDSATRSAHERRATQICGGQQGGRAFAFEPSAPDGRYHFRCVFPPPPPAPPPKPEPASGAEIEVAKKLYTDCIALKEPQFDDNLSDAATIATALQWACPGEWEAVLVTLQRGSDMPGAVKTGAEQGRHGLVLRVVLEVRAKRQPAVRAAQPPASNSRSSATKF